MSYAPDDLLDVRVDLRRYTGLSAVALGIVGDPAHNGGYHCGHDRITTSDYSWNESPRDRSVVSDAASALDIGQFDVTTNGNRRTTLRTLSAAIVEACQAGDPRARDIREVIWSLDGVTVRRWDRLGRRSSGDSSHRAHTHLSFFRDSEGRRNRPDNFAGLLTSIFEGDTVALTAEDKAWIMNNVTSGLRRGVWEAGFLDSSLDQSYRGGPVLATIDESIGALSNKVQGIGDALLSEIRSAPAVALSDVQIETIADRISAALVTSPDNALTEADLPAIGDVVRAEVKSALREGTGF